MVVSVDGAMVPLIGGEWTEVKTLAIGEPTPADDADVHVGALSYFSRVANADTFGHLALSESSARRARGRRGGRRDRRGGMDPGLCGPALSGCAADFGLCACGPAPGADWPRGVGRGECAGPALDAAAVSRPQTRGTTSGAGRGVAPAACGPDRRCGDSEPGVSNQADRAGAISAVCGCGWPMGSGMVESANKLVVEAQLKGSGMHWARDNVNAMLAVRNVVCNDRWAEGWAQMQARRRGRVGARRQARQQRAQAAAAAAHHARLRSAMVARVGTLAPEVEGGPVRPGAAHPWRRAFQPHLRDHRPPNRALQNFEPHRFCGTIDLSRVTKGAALRWFYSQAL